MSLPAIEVPENGWEVQPAAFELVSEILQAACDHCPALDRLKRDMLSDTGTRLIDWIDHLAVPAHQWDGLKLGSSHSLIDRLQAAGFVPTEIAHAGTEHVSGSVDPESYWVQPQGIFPKIQASVDVTCLRVAIKVDSVCEFLLAHGWQDCVIEGASGGRMLKSMVIHNAAVQVYVVERRGWGCWNLPSDSPANIAQAAQQFDRLRCRNRGLDQTTAFADGLKRIRAAVNALGEDWACALFFQAEREYWQRRNHAARVQKQRQDALGLGWANHDHHTYRCSRDFFPQLVECLEALGVRCRERFYAGKQAGWGAQVLEQPVVGIVIFADVDLQPEELSGDFAHEGFGPLDQMGTVGLWCLLHGDSFAAAGLHHLECQFDFHAARQQLEAAGVSSMKPFTDFEFLKQSFTAPEMWAVDSVRLERAVTQGAITRQQADQMQTQGAIGSHLEVLERNDGYKGFNQTGISDIISKTDPRKVLASASEGS